MTFVFDNNLPPALARAINALLQVDKADKAVHLTERFPPDTPDTHWIRQLGGSRGHVIISGDLRITRNPHERKAWQDAKPTSFFLKKGWINLTLWRQAARLFEWWPDIMKQARLVQPGAGFLVPVRYNGEFEQVKPLWTQPL